MKVLHLFSNAKWTGPAEPALNLCVALRRAGVEADFACAPNAGAAVNKVVATARDRGLEPILEFHLSKHAHPIKNALDKLALARFLKRRPYDVLHCHLDNDHQIGLTAARKLGVPLVRSSYYGEGFPETARHRKLLAGTAFLIEPSKRAMERDEMEFGFPCERMRVVPGAVDLERFDPMREVPDARSWLGIPPRAFVVGIVARLQTHRHYEDFFQAVRKLVDREPNTRAIVVGRGTKQAEVGKQPVVALGLQEHVHFPGFVEGEEYVGMLKAFDAFVFLVPGSDGTCRAVREAMAMAKPVVAADRGMLREIVDDGETGFICDGSPESLSRALHRLATNLQLARALGRAARAKALREFSLDSQAGTVKEIYQRLVNK
ncbi:MAG: glycosyltransferase family 4 protein [Candidatus Hydrogenedentes bacterium]|nr:glycosyltransferase family 4 protein [Candidatus Hydrogenedentota bacterium]